MQVWIPLHKWKLLGLNITEQTFILFYKVKEQYANNITLLFNTATALEHDRERTNFKETDF